MDKNTRVSVEIWDEYLGNKIYRFKITNKNGCFVELTNYGATVVSIVVPDRNGQLGNVVLGFPLFSGYLKDDCYLGATIGRFANRIAKACFNIDGVNYALEANDNGNSNHSASSGFNTKIFSYQIIDDVLSFSFSSKNMEGGYPGNVTLKVSYEWTDENELLISYLGKTDQKTVLNITNHSYFNLTAQAKSILDHELTIHSDLILDLDDRYIPTGAILQTDDRLFNKKKIAEVLDVQADGARGLNSYYILKSGETSSAVPAAILKDPGSGRVLSIFTSYPGVMLYTGQYLHSRDNGHLRQAYQPFDGLCLECQYYPDSPNHPDFPSTLLDPNDDYKELIILKFNVETK